MTVVPCSVWVAAIHSAADNKCSSRLKCISGHSADPSHTLEFNTLNGDSPQNVRDIYSTDMAQTAKLAKALQPGLSEVSTALGQLQASDPGH